MTFLFQTLCVKLTALELHQSRETPLAPVLEINFLILIFLQFFYSLIIFDFMVIKRSNEQWFQEVLMCPINPAGECESLPSLKSFVGNMAWKIFSRMFEL